MCDFGEPDVPLVQGRQCPHGTIRLTVNHTTLQLSSEELIALHRKLCACIRVEDEPGRPLPRRTRRFELN